MDRYFLSLCLERGIPEDAALDLRESERFGQERFIYAIASGTASYDSRYDDFGPLGEAGFVNCVGVFDESELQRSEELLYGITQIIEDFYSHCREQNWVYR